MTKLLRALFVGLAVLLLGPIGCLISSIAFVAAFIYTWLRYGINEDEMDDTFESAIEAWEVLIYATIRWINSGKFVMDY